MRGYLPDISVRRYLRPARKLIRVTLCDTRTAALDFHHRMNSVPVNIYWSANDSAFIAEARELPGCTAHGDTYEQALKNIRDAIQLRLDTEKEGDDFSVS